MSCTSQIRGQQEMTQFTFGNPQISVNKSIEFMKKMTLVTISQITFLRQVFSESSYGIRSWKGNKIPILKNGGNESALMVNWLSNAFGVITQKKLKKIFFVIEKGCGEDIIETYTFHYTYNLGEIKCHIQNMETDYETEMRNTSEELPQVIITKVRNLLSNNKSHLNRLPPLPESVSLKIYLEFNDNVPEDFELPKGFRPLDTIDLNFPADVHTLKIGHVDSKFTTFALKTKSALLSNTVNSEEHFSEQYNEEKESVNSARQTSFTYSSEYQKENSEPMSVNTDDKILECICEQEDDIDTIKCVCCSTYQHKPCYMLLVHQTVDKHICVSCHDPTDNRMCTNVKLLGEQGKNEAIYRRALSLCESKKKVSVNTFVSHLNLPRKEAMVIFRRLKDDGCFINESKKRSICIVNMEHLKENIFISHFNTANNVSKDSEEYIPGTPNSADRKRKCNTDGSINRKHLRFASSVM